ncbi:MAG TPA: cupin domain-containing protein [Chloroflexota bacterium]
MDGDVDESEFRPQVYEDVGPKLRAHRERAGLSLRELARQVGVSASMISQIETSKAQPSVGTLYAVVSKLGVSMDELFTSNGSNDNDDNLRSDGTGEPLPLELTQPTNEEASTGTEPGSPVQRADRRKAIRLAGGVRWERLTAQHDRDTDFLFVVYEPGAASSDVNNYMRHAGKEYGLVLSGQLAVAVGFEEYLLRPGDSISFDSTVPHRLWNPGTQTVHGIWVVTGRYSRSPDASSVT